MACVRSTVGVRIEDAPVLLTDRLRASRQVTATGVTAPDLAAARILGQSPASTPRVPTKAEGRNGGTAKGMA